jgi:hypothetical protein
MRDVAARSPDAERTFGRGGAAHDQQRIDEVLRRRFEPDLQLP